MRSCKNCGCVNDNINRYCRNCGCPFDNNRPFIPFGGGSEQSAEPAAEQPTPSPEEMLPPAEEKGLDAWQAPPALALEEKAFEAEAAPSDAPPAGADFFDLTPPAAPLFGVVESIPEEPVGYIDFDLGEGEPIPFVEKKPSEEERFRAVGRSAVFTQLAVFSVCGFILGLARIALGLDSLYTDTLHLLYLLGFDRMGAVSASAFVLPVSLAVQLLGLIPAGICAVGFCVHSADVRSRMVRLPVRGLSLLTVGSGMRLAVCSVAAALCLVFSMNSALALSSATEPDMPQAIGSLVLTLGMELAALLGILYNSLALKNLFGLKRMVKTGEPYRRVSVIVMVLNLLSAVVFSTASGFCLAGYDTLSFALSCINMVTYLLLTAVLIKIRFKEKD